MNTQSWSLDAKDKFEAAKTCYLQQVTLLMNITRIDLQIFSGYLTIQLVLAGWAAQAALGSPVVRSGVAIVDAAITLIAVALLWRNKIRRGEVVQVIKSLNTALGYSVKGAYLENVLIQPNFDPHYFLPWYTVAAVVSLLGVNLVIWGS